MKSTVAALTAVALALSACAANTPPADPLPTTAPPTAPTPDEPVTCPDPASIGSTLGVTELPADPAGVLLCDLDGTTHAPEQELTTEPERLVTQFNRAEPFSAETTLCTADAGPAYAMVFRYPDRDSIVVTSMMGGCRQVGGRHGGEELLGTFVELMNAQRTAAPPGAAVAARACEGPTASWIPVELADLTTLSRCERQPDGALVTRGTASAEQWATLREDLVTNTTAVDAPPAIGGDEQILIAVDRFGQPLTLRWSGDVATFWDAEPGLRSGRDQVRRLSPQSQRILEELAS
ncbi:MAG: hypothetical protein Q4F67_01675 [Propionibacteriaceae bacterium]|nr:hypothetical protein [Propionibacteriaceae bacterium]